jgi:hypothetical protein
MELERTFIALIQQAAYVKLTFAIYSKLGLAVIYGREPVTGVAIS